MSFGLQCSCGTRFDVGVESAGGTAPCPNCGRVLDLPTTAECAAVTSGFAPADRPSVRLASALQVGVASFFGGPFAGFLLIGRNYGRLGRRTAAWTMVAVGFVLTTVAIAIALSLPDSSRLPAFAFSGIFIAIAYATAKATQGAILEDHQARGGELASFGTVAGRALAGLVLTFGIGIGAAVTYEFAFGDQTLRVNALEEVQYSRDVTEADAGNLARVLQEQAFFNGNSEKSARLSMDRGEYVVSFVLTSSFDDPEIQKQCLDLAGEISRAFGGKPVRIDLCDSWGTSKVKLPAQRRP